MSCGFSSGLTSGKQGTLEQEEIFLQSKDNENELKDEYIKNILPVTSPIKIPENAKITVQEKETYTQIKYQWTRGEYKYISRWHTRTPNAPINQGNSWVVERHLPGIGAGPNARPAKREVLVGKNKWIAKEKWDAAIRAKKNNTLTQEQKEMLANGHWNA